MCKKMICVISLMFLLSAPVFAEVGTEADMEQAAADLIGAGNWTFFDFDQAGVWGYPDTSVGTAGVNGFIGDSFASNVVEITMALSGLEASTVYEVYVCALANSSDTTFGIAAGFTSGALTGYGDLSVDPEAYNMGDWDPQGDGTRSNNPFVASTTFSDYARPMGTVSTDASGNLNVYVYKYDNRALYDGILLRPYLPPATVIYPLDEATDIPLDVVFSWDTGKDPVNASNPNPAIVDHYLYYKAYDALTAPAEPNFTGVSPIIVSDLTDPIEYPAAGTVNFAKDARVFWRVDENIGSVGDPCNIEGDVWSFDVVKTVVAIADEPNDIRVFEMGTADMVITFTSDTTPSATWYKYVDGGPDTALSTGGDVTVVVDYDGGTLEGSTTLSIANIEAADDGDYYCVLNNATGIDIPSASAQLIVRRLVARYGFEGNANDAIGTNDGTETAGITYGPGVVGANAIMFNRSDNVELPAGAFPRGEAGKGIDQGTVTLWVKTTTTGAEAIMGTFDDGGNAGLWFGTGTSYIRPNGGGGAPRIDFSVDETNDDQWHLLAYTYDFTSNPVTMTVYIDGEYLTGHSRDNLVYTFNDDWQYPIYLGGYNNRGSMANGFAGAVDDLRIYNYALSQHEVLDIVNEVFPGTNVCVLDFYDARLDLVEDCVIDLQDFAEFAAGWLGTGWYPSIP